jgi:hypothetical protein
MSISHASSQTCAPIEEISGLVENATLDERDPPHVNWVSSILSCADQAESRLPFAVTPRESILNSHAAIEDLSCCSMAFSFMPVTVNDYPIVEY